MRKNIITIIIAIFLLTTLVYLFAISKTPSPATPSGKLKVTASFYPMYYFASQIAGDKAEVINITPAGAEPHDYEPTAQQIAHIQNTNMLILNGGTLETWGNKIKDELTSKNIKIIIAGEDIINKTISEDGKAIQDPHVWLDPLLAKQQVEKITQGFIQIDPANTSFYKANSISFKNKLDVLHEEYAAGLSSCARKDFVTSHAAFSYLSDRYKLKQVAIAGISPDAEPSIQKMAEIIDLIKGGGIKYIFFESLISPKLAETIAEETGARTLVLDPIEGISDQDVRAGKDYFTQMEMNLNNLEVALQCQI
jgi:zinc transport system substrate-binding protein